MYPTHGYWCNTRTFPTNCPSCGSAVFFFRCDHESRVFFDALGSPWPLHNCFVRNTRASNLTPAKPRPSGKSALTTLAGVSFSVQRPNHGLLSGLFRGIDGEIVQRIKSNAPSLRDTVKMEPLGSGQETLIGVVSDIHTLSLIDRFDIGADTIGANLLEQQLGTLNVTQVTILVDDIAIDPAAEDFMSYTAWCSEDVSEALTVGSVVNATILVEDILKIGRRWVAKSLEVLS